MAQLLLSFGADPYAGKDIKGETKTAYDVFMTKNATAAQVLMNKGITCNEQDLSSSNLLIIYDLEPFKKHFSLRHGEMSLHQKIVHRQLKACVCLTRRVDFENFNLQNASQNVFLSRTC